MITITLYTGMYTSRFEPKDNTAGATCGAGKAHSSGTPVFTPVLMGSVLSFLYIYVLIVWPVLSICIHLLVVLFCNLSYG